MRPYRHSVGHDKPASRTTTVPSSHKQAKYVRPVINIASSVPFGIDVDGFYKQVRSSASVSLIMTMRDIYMLYTWCPLSHSGCEIVSL